MTFISYGTPESDDQAVGDDDTLWGWDDTGLVGVGLAPDEQLRDVTIDNAWKSKIDADALSTAVFSAYMAAVQARVTAYPHGAPTPAPDPTRAADADPAAPTEIPEIDFTLMEQVDRERDDYLASFEESLDVQHSYASRDGNVTVTASGGSPTSITFDSTWMRFAAARDIAESVTEALTPAIESGQVIAAEMRERFPAIAEFRRLRAIKKAARGF